MTCGADVSVDREGAVGAFVSSLLDTFANVYLKYVLIESRMDSAFLQFYISAACAFLCLPPMLKDSGAFSLSAAHSSSLLLSGLLFAMQNVLEIFLVDHVGP